MARLKISTFLEKILPEVHRPDSHRVSYALTVGKSVDKNKNEIQFYSNQACFASVNAVGLTKSPDHYQQFISVLPMLSSDNREVMEELVKIHAEKHKVRFVESENNTHIYISELSDWHIDDLGAFLMSTRNVTEQNWGATYRHFVNQGFSKRTSMLLSSIMKASESGLSVSPITAGHSWFYAISFNERTYSEAFSAVPLDFVCERLLSGFGYYFIGYEEARAKENQWRVEEGRRKIVMPHRHEGKLYEKMDQVEHFPEIPKKEFGHGWGSYRAMCIKDFSDVLKSKGVI